MKQILSPKSIGPLLLALLFSVALLLPMMASANEPAPAHARPLSDIFMDDFWVPENCGLSHADWPYQRIPFPYQLTSPADIFPDGYLLTFRSHGMYPSPDSGSMCWCDVVKWQYNNQKLPFDQGTMTGQIMERPLPDGTALIRATLHYENVPFRVYPLINFVSACDESGLCDTSLYTPIVVNGRMSMQLNMEFVILSPGSRLSLDNWDWSKLSTFTLTGKGVGTFTGTGGFVEGKKALVRTVQVSTPGRAYGNMHWDGAPAEILEVTVQE